MKLLGPYKWPYPDAPCIEYLHIFTCIYHKFKPNVGKIFHTWSIWVMTWVTGRGPSCGIVDEITPYWNHVIVSERPFNKIVDKGSSRAQGTDMVSWKWIEQSKISGSLDYIYIHIFEYIFIYLFYILLSYMGIITGHYEDRVIDKPGC